MSLAKKIEQKRRAKKVAERNKKMKIATVGVAAGVTAGALGGILLAPKSGKETRLDLKDKSQKVATTVNEKSQQAKVKVNEKLNNGKANFQESKNKIKEYLQSKKNLNENEEIENEDVIKLEQSETQGD